MEEKQFEKQWWFNSKVELHGSAMGAGLSRQTEYPERSTNTQLFLIGNSAPMADLHSGVCTSLNPWLCQTQPWGEVGRMREKNKRVERLEECSKRKQQQQKEKSDGYCILCVKNK